MARARQAVVFHGEGVVAGDVAEGCEVEPLVDGFEPGEESLSEVFHRRKGRGSAFDDAEFDGFHHDADGFEPVNGFVNGFVATVDFDADDAEVGAKGGVADIEEEIEFTAELVYQRQGLEVDEGIEAEPEATFGKGHLDS